MVFSVHQPQYLPWLGFFDKIDKSDCFVFLDDVQYKHREYQNRNKIRVKDGWIWLTVPVRCERGEKVGEVVVDNSRDWAAAHLKSLQSFYGRAEFFEQHFPFFRQVYLRSWQRLADLNLYLLEYLFKVLGLEKKIYLESRLGAGGAKTERIINIAKKIEAGVYLSGTGGRDYLDEGLFEREKIGLRFQEFRHPLYRQQYSQGQANFVPYLSVVDLLFNEGPRSLEIIRKGVACTPSTGA